MITKNSFIIFVLILLVSIHLALVLAVPLAAEEEKAALDKIIEEAIDNNPPIQAAYDNWRAAREKIKEVSGPPNPVSSYAYFGENIEHKCGRR